MQAFWGGAMLPQPFVVVFWILRTVSPVNFPEFSTWKTILFINFSLFTKDKKWKRENGIISVVTNLTKDGPSINQSTVSEQILLQTFFYKHWLESSMDTKFELLQGKNYIQHMNDEISHREVFSLSFVIGSD